MGGHEQYIAVVGMACIFPGAENLTQYWDNIVKGYDAITDVPAHRWDPVYYDPSSSAVDRFYCKRGGFIDDYAEFDTLSFHIMPVAAEGAEPDQLLTLQVSHAALKDAGYFEKRNGTGNKTGIVLGRGNYIGAGITRLAEIVRTGEQIVQLLKHLLPGISDKETETVRKQFQTQVGSFGPDTAIGLVPNLTASRVANRLDLQGPAYTVDAACASSLIAIDHACRELNSGRCDYMLAGGIHTCHDVSFWSVFTQLGAMSRNQEIRPYDKRADGVLIGEGIGMVVLKRLEDAEKNADRIYAVIKGIGISSDGKTSSLMNPSITGQIRALEEAWHEARLSPESIGYLEGHGTATPVGDDAELATLAKVFGTVSRRQPRAGLGSVKSMIGHCMPAAGVAGFIKTVLALYHDILPPTIHCEHPKDLIDQTRFKIINQPESWSDSGLNKIAGLNAFGFGGINSHVILEEHKYPGNSPTYGFQGVKQMSAPDPVLILARDTHEDLIRALQNDETDYGSGDYRIAIFNPNDERRTKAVKIISKNIPWRGRLDIWYSNESLVSRGGKIAFLFPGIDSFFDPQMSDVIDHFNFDTPKFLKPKNLEETGAGVLEVNRILDSAVRALGIQPSCIAGHSIGEWSGYIASGMITRESLERLLRELKPGSLKVPGVLFLAAGCGADGAKKAMTGLKNIAVSHDNCPHQTIICGEKESIDACKERLLDAGVLCQVLPFQSGFHSPLFKNYLKPHEKVIKKLEVVVPEIPVWSATTCAPFPLKPDAMKKQIMDHLLNPVLFTQLIKELYKQGVRVFIQTGVGSLPGFIQDTLKGKSVLTISANLSNRPGMEQLRRLAAALLVEGAHLETAAVGLQLQENLDTNRSSKPLKLQLGVPIIRDFTPLEMVRTTKKQDLLINNDYDNSITEEFRKTIEEITEIQDDILELFHESSRDVERKNERDKPARNDLRTTPPDKEFMQELEISLETYPELNHHTLFPQKKGWEDIEDWFPVVPMTMSLQLLLEAARTMAPGKKVITVENCNAIRWMPAAEPLMVKIKGKFITHNNISLEIENHITAQCILAEKYPDSPNPEAHNPKNPEPTPVNEKQLYSEGWMFHGPAYQGVVKLGPMSREGIVGSLKVTQACGALLDNAGQLFGYWVMLNTDKDRLALPIRVKKIQFFGDDPEPGAELQCFVRGNIKSSTLVSADMELVSNNVVWARITGWEDRRFITDDRLWPMMREPGKYSLSIPLGHGITVFTNIYKTVNAREYVSHRYLNRVERKILETLSPRAQGPWLAGRIAVKDAIRNHLWEKGSELLYPAEFTILNNALGKPYILEETYHNLDISIAHKHDLGVGIVSENGPVGIDIEKIEQRSGDFEKIAFQPDEIRLLPKRNRNEWVTRFWAAKEAYSKMRGLGLEANPKKLKVNKVMQKNRIVIENTVIETRKHDSYVIAWCKTEE